MSKNIPYHKFTLLNKDNELEQTLFVRMGSPTINNDKKTKIAPEFLGYLHYIKRFNKHHTYINLQDARSMKISQVKNPKDFLKSMKFNFEAYRVAALHTIPDFQGLDETIEVITLSKDSNFYHQGAPYDKPSKKERFFQSYLNVLVNNKEGYILPKSWTEKKSSRHQELIQKLAQLYEIFFESKKIVSCEDKRFFIDLSYALIIDMAQNGSDFLNITCKDGIDRAGVFMDSSIFS